jgi:hypothetical protein
MSKKKTNKALEDLTSLAKEMLSFEVEDGSPSHEFLKLVALGMEDSIQVETTFKLHTLSQSYVSGPVSF